MDLCKMHDRPVTIICFNIELSEGLVVFVVTSSLPQYQRHEVRVAKANGRFFEAGELIVTFTNSMML